MEQIALSIIEQVEKAMDGRTQRWLAFNTRIPETDLSKKMNGKMPFTQEDLDKINSVFEVNIQLEAQP